MSQAVLPVDSVRDALPHLRRPFTAAALKWKIQTNPKDDTGYALCVGFIDARLASERLNAVCPHLWSHAFKPIEGGQMCAITMRELPESSISGTMREQTRSDVGWSKGTAAGMDLKAVYSDAFKRAAVHWGVGVSVYAMPQQFLKGGTDDLKKLRSGWKITDAGLRTLSSRYEAWLKGPGSVFGEPLDHGDAVGSVGDVEAGGPDLGPADEKPAKAPAKERKISKAGLGVIEGLLDKSGARPAAETWLTAQGIEGGLGALADITAAQGKELHDYLKGLE